MTPTPIERLLAKVAPQDDGCWIWQAATNGKRGYGVFKLEGRQQLAHRAAYQLLVGSIPEGLTIDHLCQVHLCVNPDHLEPVDNAENHRRWIATITHCPQGHEYSPANTVMEGNRRRCRICRREISRRVEAKRRLRRRQQYRERVLAGPPPDRHGMASTYKNWGCRCDPCRAARRAAS